MLAVSKRDGSERARERWHSLSEMVHAGACLEAAERYEADHTGVSKHFLTVHVKPYFL